jgi:hypothetical protein
VGGKMPTARLALYSPSACVAENVVRTGGLSRAAAIVRAWRSERGSRHALLLPWARRIGVGVRVGTFKGARVTTAAAYLSAAHPKAARPKLAPPPPAPAPPASPPPPSGPVVGVPYTCNGPVHGLRVVGTGSDVRALVSGCTLLDFDIHVTSGGGGVVHAGATIGPSRIV